MNMETSSDRQGQQFEALATAGHDTIKKKTSFPDISINFYEKEIPPFIMDEANHLYGSLFSSPEKLNLEGKLVSAKTYLARKNGKIIAILFFRLVKNRAQVLNECINLDPEEIRRFSEEIFLKFRQVTVIQFSAIETSINAFPFIFQKRVCSENLIIDLPSSPEAYLNKIGNATRRNIKYYSNKLRRNFPSFRYDFYHRDGVKAEHIKSILTLKAARMKSKRKAFDASDSETEELLSLLKACNGSVGIATIDGHFCGGQISYRIGSNDTGLVICHDQKYNDYSLGIIICYLTVCDSIARGAVKFNFHCGREEYKYRLLGVQHDLYNLDIYRSKADFILNGKVVLSGIYHENMRRIRFWILDPKRKNSFIARSALNCARLLKNLRWTMARPKSRQGSVK